MIENNDPPGLIVRVLLALPIIGYGVRCAREERIDELLSLIGVILMAAVLAVLIWGLPGFTTVLYGLLILVATSILLATFAR